MRIILDQLADYILDIVSFVEAQSGILPSRLSRTRKIKNTEVYT